MKPVLLDKKIVLPENRQIDLLASLLEKEQASVIRCPMFAIQDAPDLEPIYEWIKQFIQNPFDLFIILTGEGLFRLTRFAENIGLKTEFRNAIAKSKTMIRGPKPRKALSAIGLKPDIIALHPTTDGIIKSLTQLNMNGYRVGIQLYGEEPNIKLIDFLKSRNVQPIVVAPYIYAKKSDDKRVIEIIKSIQSNQVDLIAFTSNEQVKRMKNVLKRYNKNLSLKDVLISTTIAAVGPVVLDTLQAEGINVQITPKKSYFLKPMINEIKNFYKDN